MPNERHQAFLKFWEETDPNKERKILPGIGFYQSGCFNIAIVESQMFVNGVEKRWVEWFWYVNNIQHFAVAIYSLHNRNALRVLSKKWNQDKGSMHDIYAIPYIPPKRGGISLTTHHPKDIYHQLVSFADLFDCQYCMVYGES
jgi:hypothetical protein